MSKWADLPKEILELTGKCIDSRVDVLRFRSVCNSWRSSVSFPSFDDEIPFLILKIPQPIAAEAILIKSTICRVHFSNQNSGPSSCSSTKGWLTKVGESQFGKLKLQNPVSDCQIRYPQLNLLDINFTQLSKGFMLKYPSGKSVYGVNKVVLFPNKEKIISKDEISLLAIFHGGKLGYWKHGDKNWTLLDKTNFNYDDIIEFKGQFYVVDTWGIVCWIDSSLKLIQYSPPLFGRGGQKHLVESNGELYIVDKHLDGKRKTWNDYRVFRKAKNNGDHVSGVAKNNYDAVSGDFAKNAIYFSVHKLDEEWGKWVDVKSLDDRAFVLGIDCNFSNSCSDFVGGKGNCIYFTDNDDVVGKTLTNESIRVFRMEYSSIMELGVLPRYSEVFWPPNNDIGSKGKMIASI